MADNIRRSIQSLYDVAVSEIKKIFPIETDKYIASIEKIYHENPHDVAQNYAAQKDATINALDFVVDIKADLKVKNKETKKEFTRQNVTVLNIPAMTNHGTFIIDGNQYFVKHQLRRRPGVYARIMENGEFETEVLVAGANYKIRLEPDKGKIFLMYRNKKIPFYHFLRYLDVPDNEILRSWGSKLHEINKGELTDSIIRRINSMFKVEGPEKASQIKNIIGQKELDQNVVGITLEGYTKERTKNLDPKVFLAASKKLIDVSKGDTEPDDRDIMPFKQFVPFVTIVRQYLSNTVNMVKNNVMSTLDRIESPEDVDDTLNVDYARRAIKKFFSLDLANTVENSNILGVVSEANKVTLLGEGAITDEHTVPVETRNINPTQLGIVDPVHTPDGKVGLVNHFTLGTSFSPTKGRLETKVFNLKTKKYEELNPNQMFREKIAFPDQFDKNNKPLYPAIRVVHKGKIVESSPESVTYLIKDPQDMFDVNTNLIPFLGTNSGNRMTMASKMLTQAVGLVDPDLPLVDTLIKGKPGVEYAGNLTGVSAPTSGKITKANDKEVVIENRKGRETTIRLQENVHIGGNHFLTDKPVVKVGDEVSEGDMVAENNFMKDRKLALGKNLLTAYLPGKGYTFEDGFVISEGASHKLVSAHIENIIIDKKDAFLAGKNKFNSLFPGTLSGSTFSKLDDDGVVKEGTIIDPDEPIFVSAQKVDGKDLKNVNRKFQTLYKKYMQSWEGTSPGRVLEVHKTPTRYVIKIKTEEPAQVGDKLVGRYGNKGTITKVVPDAEMVKTKDGNVIDMIISSAAVPSRVNPGQLLETALSKAALKRGKPYNIRNFDSDESAARFVMDELKKHDLSDKEILVDPGFGELKNPVGTGYQYVMKMEQQAKKKAKAQSVGQYDVNRQPIGGVGAQALDRLTVNALLAHGATEILGEASRIKGTENDDYWMKVKMGLPAREPTETPYAFEKFKGMLETMGVGMKRTDDQMTLVPMTNEEITKRSSGEITDSRSVIGKNFDEIKGGLFDPRITGGLDGQKWSHISLAEPIVNPVFEDVVTSILGLKSDEYTALVKGDKFMDDDGNLVDERTSQTSFKAIRNRLKKIDIKSELSQAKEELKTAKDMAKKNKLYKKIAILSNFSKNDQGLDSIFIDKIPVMPPVFRPVYEREGNVIQSPLNTLYSHIILTKEKHANAVKNKPEYYKHRNRAAHSLYESVKGLYGIGDVVTLRGREYPGIIETLAGNTPKTGYYQHSLIRKRQDLSGRAVASLNTELGPDEIGLPKKLAWEMYKPFVMRKMSLRGFKPSQTLDHINNQTPLAEKILAEVAEERPVLLNRSPSLHKFNVMAFQPKLVDDVTIQVNPLITTGFNLDFDGDTMAAHVPATDKAVEEARGLMPSKVIFSPANFKPMMSPKEDALMGLNLLTSVKKDSDLKFDSHKEAVDYFMENKESPYIGIEVAGKKTSFGREYLKNMIPEDLVPEEPIKKSNLDGYLRKVYEKDPGQYATVVDKLVREGNKFAYYDGFSVGASDIVDIPKKERKSVFERVLKESRKFNKVQNQKNLFELKNVMGRGFGDSIKILDEHFKGKDNNFYNMVDVGSKGNKSQLTQMLVAPMSMTDVSNRPNPIPVGRSYAEGLKASDYYLTLFGARKGSVDSKLEVQEPGYIAKQLVATTSDNVITTEDCGTTKGIKKSTDDPDITDRVIARGTGKYRAGDQLNPMLLEQMKKDGVKEIFVRSPLYCEAHKGTCAKCYGLDETGRLPNIGTNIGIIAATSVSEPLTQMALNTKHIGGVSSTRQQELDVAEGFPRIKQVYELPSILRGAATYAKRSGTVEGIEKLPMGGHKMVVGTEEYFVPQQRTINVKVGDQVKKGEQMTSGVINPKDYMKDMGVEKTRELMVDHMKEAYEGAGKNIKTKLFETITRSLTDWGRVTRSEIPEVLPGSYIRSSEAAQYKDKVDFEPELKGVNQLPLLNPDFMTRMSFNHLKQGLGDAILYGHSSNIHGYHPMPAYMFGKEFGKGTLGTY